MIVKALKLFLATNQNIITNIIPVSGTSVNTGDGSTPYIQLSEMTTDGNINDNGMVRIRVRVAYPPDYQDDLDNFVLYTLRTLLDNKFIAVVNGLVTTRTKVYVTGDITDIRETLSKYIYRDRIVEVPCRWR